MSPVTFALRSQPPTWLDLSPLTPDNLSGRTLKAIRSVKLRCGRQAVRAGDLFDISGENVAALKFLRGSPHFVRLGHGMARGRIGVDGHAGHYLGQGMRGGRITVRGSAGDWTATGMRDGLIEITGSTGAFLGAAAAGDAHGMSGGRVVVSGSAGRRMGDRMRRGTILVFGDADEFAGSRMIAGTLLVMGTAKSGTGFGMRRGTIILGRKPAHMLATFSDCGELKMEFLRLLFKQIAATQKRLGFFLKFGPEARRFAGDLAAGGQGEILILVNPPRDWSS